MKEILDIRFNGKLNSDISLLFNKLSHEDYTVERKLNPPTDIEIKAIFEALEKTKEVFKSVGFEIIKPFDESENEETGWKKYFE